MDRPISIKSFRLFLTALVLVASAVVSPILAQDKLEKWEQINFAERKIDRAQLEFLDLEDLKFLRGIIFGRHGRVFKDAYIQKYLESRPWYKPNGEFNNRLLNATERENLDLIREVEAARHENIEPGDLRFHQKRPFAIAQLGEHTAAEWRVLRAEVEAIHGKRFDDEPWLQAYFEDRYWYEANSGYDPKRLTATELKNLRTIVAAQNKQRRVAVSPGDMEHFQTVLLTEEILKGVSLHDLRLMRNEFYARHGHIFKALWLEQHFAFQPWYLPIAEGEQITAFSEIEKQNVDLIVLVEKRLREELSTKLVARNLLEGLFIEDARRLRDEIFARRGKVFKDKNTQAYFESLDWYNPDPDFRDQSLTRTERRNQSALLAYERKARSMLDVVEG